VSILCRSGVTATAVVVAIACTPELPAIDELPSAVAPARTPKPDRRALEIHDITVSPARDVASAAAISVGANVAWIDPVPDSTGLAVKAVCRHGPHALASVASATVADGRPWADHVAGDRLPITATLLHPGMTRFPVPCDVQFELELGSAGRSDRMHTACWTGSSVADGPCEPVISGVAADEDDAPPLEIHDLSAIPAAPGFELRYVLRLNRIPRPPSHVAIESSCDLDGLRLVDVQAVAAFDHRLAMGESIARSTPMFWDPAFALAESPKRCRIDIAVWKQFDGSFAPVALGTWCLRDGTVVERCEPAPRREPAPASSASVSIRPTVQWLAPQAEVGGPYTMALRVQAQTRERIDRRLEVEVQCADVPTSWTADWPLIYLDAGGTTRFGWQPFVEEPLTSLPRSCELQFSLAADEGSPSARAPSPALALATYCWRTGKLGRGACR